MVEPQKATSVKVDLLTQEMEKYVQELSEQYHMNPEQIHKYLDLFNSLDKSSKGLIENNELETLLRDAVDSLTEQEFVDWLREIDPDGIAELDFSTFIGVVHEKLNEIDAIAEIRDVFKTFDAENTGLVDPGILRECLNNLDDRLTDQRYNELLEEFGGGEGMVEYERFILKMLK